MSRAEFVAGGMLVVLSVDGRGPRVGPDLFFESACFCAIPERYLVMFSASFIESSAALSGYSALLRVCPNVSYKCATLDRSSMWNWPGVPVFGQEPF